MGWTAIKGEGKEARTLNTVNEMNEIRQEMGI